MATSAELVCQIRTLDKKFKQACNQLVLLNNFIEYTQNRYDRAVRNNRRSFRYSYRLRLCTLEGVRNMFYEYASQSADELDTLQDRLMNEFNIDYDEVCDEDFPMA